MAYFKYKDILESDLFIDEYGKHLIIIMAQQYMISTKQITVGFLNITNSKFGDDAIDYML